MHGVGKNSDAFLIMKEWDPVRAIYECLWGEPQDWLKKGQKRRGGRKLVASKKEKEIAGNLL